MIIENKKTLMVNICGKELAPKAQIVVEDAVWKAEYLNNKSVREALRRGIIEAHPQSETKKKAKEK